MTKQTCGSMLHRIIVWKQHRSNAKNKNILNSLAAVIHKNECNPCSPALVNGGL